MIKINNRRVVLLALMLSILLVFATGCIKISLTDSEVKDEPLAEDKSVTTDLVKEDLENYLYKELPLVFNLEEEALGYYDAVTGLNYTDDYTFYNSLIDQVIPSYHYFIDELEAIRPETQQVRDIHELYIEAANLQYSGFTIFLSGVEKQDFEIMAQGNEKLDKARKLIRQWEIKIEELSKEHGINYAEQGEKILDI